MPQARMEEESEWKLPEDTLLPVRLNKVEERRIDFTYKRGDKAGQKDFFFKWEWEFEVMSGPYEGLRAWGESEDKLTTHQDNKVRLYAEALTGHIYEVGEGIDTDDLLGLECVITVLNSVRDKPDGGKYYSCPVAEAFPKGADKGLASAPGQQVTSSGAAAVQDPNDPWAAPGEEPPF